MADHQAPKEYTPEFCTSVYDRMHSALDAAINAFVLANSGQKDLTRQALKHLETSFSKIEKTLEDDQIEQKNYIDSHEKLYKDDTKEHTKAHEEINAKINKMKVQFYAGGITALVFLIGFTFAIFKIIQSGQPTP